MKYSSGSIGRIFIVRFEHKDDLVMGIDKVVKDEAIMFASIMFIGALKTGTLVTGPKYDSIPPEPNNMKFNRSHEVIGFGTIVNNGDSVLSHIHANIGKGQQSFTGCLRDAAEIFLTVEAVITEIKGIDAVRKFDPEIKQKTLNFNNDTSK